MHRITATYRPRRLARIARQVPIAAPQARAIKRQKTVTLVTRAAVERIVQIPSEGFQVDPYVDYGRHLTDEGGILLIYKDLDVRFRHIAWRVFAWTCFTGIEALYAAPYLPIENHWLELSTVLAAAVLNYFIVNKPVEIYRRIEVRPDCLIIEGQDTYWIKNMEGGYPSFRPDKENNNVLSGIYGTRFVEYLTVRRFDESDRMFEVLSVHLQDAMQRQWSRPN